jgi:tetrahydromethanopterin S-methyltransferase subunit B
MITITNNINNFNDRFAKIKKMLNNTETIGNSTLVELNKQSEQIKTINKKSNILFDQLKITKTKLNNIISSMSFYNLFINSDTIPNNTDNIEQLKTNNESIKCISHGIIIDNQTTNCDMDHISIKLEKLKSIAKDMNNEIKEQNLYINDLSINIDKLNNITHQNNNIINKAS